jgi:hypothetical protein
MVKQSTCHEPDMQRKNRTSAWETRQCESAKRRIYADGGLAARLFSACACSTLPIQYTFVATLFRLVPIVNRGERRRCLVTPYGTQCTLIEDLTESSDTK